MKNLRLTPWNRFNIAMATLLCVFFAFFTNTALAKSVYENQKTISDKELVSFIELLPRFRAWASSNGEQASPGITDGKADFLYSEKSAAWVKSRGWEPERFFCVMGKAAAALFIVAEGSEIGSQKPTDMPSVTKEELDLVRRHLAALLQAGSDAPPINQ